MRATVNALFQVASSCRVGFNPHPAPGHRAPLLPASHHPAPCSFPLPSVPPVLVFACCNKRFRPPPLALPRRSTCSRTERSSLFPPRVQLLLPLLAVAPGGHAQSSCCSLDTAVLTTAVAVAAAVVAVHSNNWFIYAVEAMGIGEATADAEQRVFTRLRLSQRKRRRRVTRCGRRCRSDGAVALRLT